MHRQTNLSTATSHGTPSWTEAASVALRKSFGSASMRRWTLALFDQGVVSGTRFLTTIIVGRAAGPDELGHYSIAFSALVLWGCLQEAIVTTPYAVYFHRLGRRSRAAYAGGSLVLHALVAAVAALTLLTVAGVSWAGWGPTALARLALVVAVTLPLSLMWEFARRSTLAQLDVAAATRLDATCAAVQVVGLIVLALLGRLNAASALLVIAAASLLVTLDWLYRSRASRVIHGELIAKYWERNWRLGKWLIASQVVGALHGMVPSLMLALLVDAAATGVFAAHLNIALIANPLILAVSNLLTPKAAQALSVEGVGAVVRLVRNAALGMAGVLGLFTATLALWGERIVGLVYGAEYAGHEFMLVALGACTIDWAISVACACGLAALRYPRGSFLATLIGTSVSVVTILLLAQRWSTMAAATGLLAGSTVAAVLHVTMFIGQYRALLTQSELGRSAAISIDLRRSLTDPGSPQECCLSTTHATRHT